MILPLRIYSFGMRVYAPTPPPLQTQQSDAPPFSVYVGLIPSLDLFIFAPTLSCPSPYFFRQLHLAHWCLRAFVVLSDSWHCQFFETFLFVFLRDFPAFPFPFFGFARVTAVSFDDIQSILALSSC